MIAARPYPGAGRSSLAVLRATLAHWLLGLRLQVCGKAVIRVENRFPELGPSRPYALLPHFLQPALGPLDAAQCKLGEKLVFGEKACKN
jgi:hypothetical protein